MHEINEKLLNQWIGKTETIEDVLTLAPARAIASMLNHEIQPKIGDELPPTWTWIYFLPTPRQSLIGADGHPQKGGFLPPVPLPRRMRAGGKVTYLSSLKIGDSVRQVQTVKNIQIKEGRVGILVFVAVFHEIFVSDELAVTEEMNLVYRDFPAPSEQLPPVIQSPQDPEWIREINPDLVMLFRYSALTMNTHRIHYDREYAINEENYQGLLVQAPLTVTLIMDLLMNELPNAHVEQINFRATRPLFDGKPIRIEGKRVDEGALLWGIDFQGALAMTVEVKLK